MVILSFLWILFSTPLNTIRPSTSAVFYVSTRRIDNREGYITSDFWFAFKANFKKATVLWLLLALMYFLILLNLLIINDMGGMQPVFFVAQIIFLVQVAFITVYIFPIIARFEMDGKQILKSAFFMANRHFLTTLSCLALSAGLVVICMLMPPLVFAAPGIYAMMASYMIIRIFKKYRPEMDRDPVVEIAEIEAKRNEEKRRAMFSRSENAVEAAAEAEAKPPEPLTVFRDGRIITIDPNEVENNEEEETT